MSLRKKCKNKHTAGGKSNRAEIKRKEKESRSIHKMECKSKNNVQRKLNIDYENHYQKRSWDKQII